MEDAKNQVKAFELSKILPNAYTKAAFGLTISYALFLFMPVLVLERMLGLALDGKHLTDWSGYLVLIAGVFAAFFHLHPQTLPLYRIGKYVLIAVFIVSILMIGSKLADLAHDPFGRQLARSKSLPLGVGAFMLPVSLLLFVMVLVANPIRNIADKE